MRIQAISTHVAIKDQPDADFACHQRANGLSALVQGALLIASLVVVMAPFSIIAAEAVAEPAMLDRFSDAPARAAVAFAGVAIWIVMFGIPAMRAFGRMGRSQAIKIAGGIVEISEKTLIGRNNWSAPIVDFEGISHHIRTSISGMRQELILVHPQATKCLLLAMDQTISQNETEALADRLGTPVIPAGRMHRRNPNARRPEMSFIETGKPLRA